MSVDAEKIARKRQRAARKMKKCPKDAELLVDMPSCRNENNKKEIDYGHAGHCLHCREIVLKRTKLRKFWFCLMLLRAFGKMSITLPPSPQKKSYPSTHPSSLLSPVLLFRLTAELSQISEMWVKSKKEKENMTFELTYIKQHSLHRTRAVECRIWQIVDEERSASYPTWNNCFIK